MSGPNAIDRAAQTRRLLEREGWRGVAARLLRRAERRLCAPGSAPLPVREQDLLEAGARGRPLPPPLACRPGQPLQIAWLCVPPSEGAGGFTTIARLIAGVEAAGHRCAIYLHDRHGWPLSRHRQTIRRCWPQVQAQIFDAADGIDDAHAIFATSWQTAYPALASPARGRRMYLVQDHEPSFYPAGSEALLAQATYTFGFRGVTAGRWLSTLLHVRYGMECDSFDFGCELGDYGADPRARRTGVCLYSRPSTPRRCFELAATSLQVFSRRHPDVDIHLFGERAGRLPFPATDHGMLRPRELNALYNRCLAGLVLSATNVSLVPYEMLAAGCIPVVNDAEHNRVVLDNDSVAYAPPTPHELADALAEIVQRPAAAQQRAAAAASASVRHASWERAAQTVERIVREAVLEAVGASPEIAAAARNPARAGRAPGRALDEGKRERVG